MLPPDSPTEIDRAIRYCANAALAVAKLPPDGSFRRIEYHPCPLEVGHCAILTVRVDACRDVLVNFVCPHCGRHVAARVDLDPPADP